MEKEGEGSERERQVQQQETITNQLNRIPECIVEMTVWGDLLLFLLVRHMLFTPNRPEPTLSLTNCWWESTPCVQTKMVKQGKAVRALKIASSQLGPVTQNGMCPTAPGLRTSRQFLTPCMEPYLNQDLGNHKQPRRLMGILPFSADSYRLWPGLFALYLHNGEERKCFLRIE